MHSQPIEPGSTIRGSTLPEAVEVLSLVQLGESLKVVGIGRKTGMTHVSVLSPQQLAVLTVSAARERFDGDACLFRLGIEAHQLGLAFEYDPLCALSISRVDPVPHQLEAVYAFLRSPRTRFLLSDVSGAGKKVMAGLLLKELKARGLVRRVLIVAPSNLTFQWKREMADKFCEKFDIVCNGRINASNGSNPWQQNNLVITAVSWDSIVEGSDECLLESRWELVIVDEAHAMRLHSENQGTFAHRFSESLSEILPRARNPQPRRLRGSGRRR